MDEVLVLFELPSEMSSNAGGGVELQDGVVVPSNTNENASVNYQ